MTNWQIRRAGMGDLDAIRAITGEGYPGVSLFERNELEWAMEHAAGVWLASSENHVSAYLVAFSHDAEYDGEEFRWFQQSVAAFLYIDRVAVAANARHTGLGARLYAFVDNFAREQGVTSLVCEVNLQPPNPVSVAFHTKQGFKEIGTLETHDGRTVSLVQKKLG